MSLIIKGAGSGSFETPPEGDGLMVCVDVTPLKKRETKYGIKEEFRFAFELDTASFGTRGNGQPYCIWSRGFTPVLSLTPKKSNLTKFLEDWLGRKFTQEDLSKGIDAESLIGRTAKVIVQHEENGENVYANILSIRPSAEVLEPSGTFVRAKDRPANGGTGAVSSPAPSQSRGEDAGTSSKSSYKPAEQPEGAGREDWQKCKIHMGRNKGVDLGDLDPEGEDMRKLIDNWIPWFNQNPKPSADDKRLFAALNAFQADYAAYKAQQESAGTEEAQGDF